MKLSIFSFVLYIHILIHVYLHNEFRNGSKFSLDSDSFDTTQFVSKHSFCQIKINYTNEYINECINK